MLENKDMASKILLECLKMEEPTNIKNKLQEILAELYKIYARELFLKLKSNSPKSSWAYNYSINDFFKELFDILNEAGLNLSDIDTYDDELKSVFRKLCVNSMASSIADMQEEGYHMGEIHEYDNIKKIAIRMEEMEISYDEIKTTRDKLSEIRRKLAIKKVNSYFDHLQRTSTPDKYTLGEMLEIMREENLKLNDTKFSAADLLFLISNPEALKDFILNCLLFCVK